LSSLFEILFTSLSFKPFIVEMFTFGGDMLPCFSCYLCLYVGIYTSEAKLLVGSCNHLSSFS
jgi:hypothetical protein